MAGKTFPWVKATVPWFDGWVFTRGVHDGLPLLSYDCAPRDKLATYNDQAAKYVRANPVPSIVGAVVVGFIVGRIISRL